MTPTDFLPEWRDTPPCPGEYITRDTRRGVPGNDGCLELVTNVAASVAHQPFARWFGPIPIDPKAEK